jgi:hypothetical protein
MSPDKPKPEPQPMDNVLRKMPAMPPDLHKKAKPEKSKKVAK